MFHNLRFKIWQILLTDLWVSPDLKSVCSPARPSSPHQRNQYWIINQSAMAAAATLPAGRCRQNRPCDTYFTCSVHLQASCSTRTAPAVSADHWSAVALISCQTVYWSPLLLFTSCCVEKWKTAAFNFILQDQSAAQHSLFPKANSCLQYYRISELYRKQNMTTSRASLERHCLSL